MTCSKLPIKLRDFSTGCARIASAATATTLGNLTSLNTSSSIGGVAATLVAYLILKCGNIACPPNLVFADSIGAIANSIDSISTWIGTSFVNASGIVINPEDVTTGDFTGSGGTILVQYALLKGIAGCCCCSQ